MSVLRRGVADGRGGAAPHGGARGRQGVPLHDLQISGQHAARHAHSHTHALPQETCRFAGEFLSMYVFFFTTCPT